MAHILRSSSRNPQSTTQELIAVPKPGAEYEDDVVILVTMLGGELRGTWNNYFYFLLLKVPRNSNM